MGPRIDGEAMNSRLDREVLELADVRAVVHLKHRDRATRACDVDAPEAEIERHDVGAARHGEMRGRAVRIEVDNRQHVVALAREESAAVLGVDRHPVVSLATIDAMAALDRVRGGVDHRQTVLVLQIDIDLSGDRVVLRDTGLTVKA